MKYVILAILILAAASGAGIFFYLNSQTSSAPAITTTSPVGTSPSSTSALPKDTFHWGVVVRPYGLKGRGMAYDQTLLATQIDLAKELKVTDVRANVESEQATNDDFVNLSIAAGLKPTLILEPTDPTYLDTDTYSRAYNYALAVALRYKGRVPYYQLANEASGVAIKPNVSGNKTTDYDDTKYTKLKNIIKGLGDGVRAGDPAALRIVSANWLGTGIIDKLVTDKVQFDIIGWNWYSDMGDDLVKKLDTGSTLNIPQYLSTYGKKFWVVELNRRQGTFDKNEKAQSDFLKTFIANATKHTELTGVFVYTLTDECGDLDKEHGNLGLVSVTKNANNNCTVKAKKAAFTTFQQAIKQYSK